MRVFRLCLLSILLPGLLIAGPLYLRYKVFSEQVYPLGLSDMRLVDGKISTTWCQKQLVKSNATFSAYLLPEEPQVKPNPVVVSMVKYLTLEDDMKEYWGFYLLKGVMEVVMDNGRMGMAPRAVPDSDRLNLSSPGIGKIYKGRARHVLASWPGASLIVIKGHSHLRECAYIGDNSSEEMEELEELDRQRAEEAENVEVKVKANSRNELWPLKKARDSIEFHRSSGNSKNSNEANSRSKHEVDANANDWKIRVKSRRDHESISIFNSLLPAIDLRRGSSDGENETLSLKTPKNFEMTEKSEEIYESIKHQLSALRSRKSSLLSRLKEVFNEVSEEKSEATANNKNNTAAKVETAKDFSSSKGVPHKREISLWSLQRELNKEDDSSDAADEEDAGTKEDIRGTINGTTVNDMSNSEFWSSFSSSEERLMSCAGLILNLPLTPSKSCHPSKSETTQAKASLTNKLTYKVPGNGYYFFVFSSENEIQPNYIRIHFHLEKMIYNVSNPVAACMNTTDSCSLPLNFFSREKVVLEMPVSSNETAENQEYVVVSVCEPRTMVYAACVIAVPILILLFAF